MSADAANPDAANPADAVDTADVPHAGEPVPSTPGDHRGDPVAVTVYWRPGCGFCSGLLRSLDRFGLACNRRNIWEDDQAAAFVRSVADGSETVPTVTVGDRVLVNPTGDEVMALVAEYAPERLPHGWEPRKPGLLTRLLGG